jgi:hypothetical protein
LDLMVKASIWRPPMRTDAVTESDSGAAVLAAAALAAVFTLVIWMVAQTGVVLLDRSRATTAADALALAAVVWQGADLSELAATHRVEVLEVTLWPPEDLSFDLEVFSAAVTVRYKAVVTTARAMARDLPLPTMAP